MIFEVVVMIKCNIILKFTSCFPLFNDFLDLATSWTSLTLRIAIIIAEMDCDIIITHDETFVKIDEPDGSTKGKHI